MDLIRVSKKTYIKQIEHIYDTSKVIEGGYLLFVIIFSVLLLGVPAKATILFIAALFITSFVKIFIILLYNRFKKEKWILLHSFGAFLTGSVWGIGSLFLIVNGLPLEYKYIFYTIILGFAAVAMFTLGFVFYLYYLFIIPLLTPTILYFFYLGNKLSISSGIVVIIAIFFLIKLRERLLSLFIELENNNIKLIERERLLQEQSKLALMGEMIGSISHQWRQPLNEITINIQNLKYDYEDNLINEKFIKEFIEHNKNTINFMSQTIDDFRNFFRIDKEKEEFNIKEVINSTTSILSGQFKNQKISCSIIGEDFKVFGYKGEFQQVILNILNNARDALIENNIKNKSIDIILENNKVSIIDNAGGIDKEIISRVFEPYFTTKDQGKGIGIGLYMSKVIIEKNMNGKLSVENTESGAKFTIEL